MNKAHTSYTPINQKWAKQIPSHWDAKRMKAVFAMRKERNNPMVSRDKKYQNAMRNSDKQNARMESERALQQVIVDIMADNMELFKQFQDNPSFKKWLSDLVFNLTYNEDGNPYDAPNSDSKSK